MIRLLHQHAVLVVAGIVFTACLVGLFVLNSNVERELTPKRVAPVPSSSATLVPQPPKASSTPLEDVPLVIEASDIVRVSVPAIDLDVQVSGETSPRQTPRCKGSDYCIDPPVPDQAAWYGDPPSFPSTNPVLLFGHTSWSYEAYATFNDLPAMVAGDLVIVTTKTGIFTYQAKAPALVPYSEAPQSELIFGSAPEKLVLVTCNDKEAAATVVVAYLIDAVST